MDLLKPDSSLWILLIIILLGVCVVGVLFILTQQNTLKAIRPEHRELRPGQVWLQLIPLINLYWQFIVVTRIADSISRQNASFQDDSILGIPDYDAVAAVGKRPTYAMGIAFCTLMVANSVLSYISSLAMLQGVVALGGIICWIIYWVQLAEVKRKLVRSQQTVGPGF